MSIETTIESLLSQPIDPTKPRPANDSLRGIIRGELRAIALELRKRRKESKTGLAAMTSREEKVAKFFVGSLKAAAEEYAAENQPIPISLAEVTPETLQKILNGEEAIEEAEYSVVPGLPEPMPSVEAILPRRLPAPPPLPPGSRGG